MNSRNVLKYKYTQYTNGDYRRVFVFFFWLRFCIRFDSIRNTWVYGKPYIRLALLKGKAKRRIIWLNLSKAETKKSKKKKRKKMGKCSRQSIVLRNKYGTHIHAFNKQTKSAWGFCARWNDVEFFFVQRIDPRIYTPNHICTLITMKHSQRTNDC